MAQDGSNKITVYFIVGFLVLVTVGVIIAAAVSGGASSTSTASVPATTVPPLTAADHTTGDQSSTVTVIEYGDFQCPACGEYYPVYKQLIQDYGNRVLFAFRNFPLYTIHPDAGIAAQAAEAAALQGKYWEMHDQLYDTQTTWSTATPDVVVNQYFNGYAQTLGLDVTKFDADVNSAAVMNKIQSDVTSGNNAQVDHTPTFFVNLTQIANPASYDDFKSVIDAALASSTTP